MSFMYAAIVSMLLATLLLPSSGYAEQSSPRTEEKVTLQNAHEAKSQAKMQETCDHLPSRLKIECEASFLLNEAEEKMMSLYDQLYARLQAKHAKDSLSASQEAWVLYKRKSCEYEASAWLSGTGMTAQVLSCEVRKTGERIKEIKGLLSCKDDGCPL